MDLTQKIEQLTKEYEAQQAVKDAAHARMKEIKKRISQYQTVLKHAQEIEEPKEEKQPV